MGEIKFIHGADAHLGSFLKSTGEMPEELAETFKRATFEAFAHICEAAIKHEVDFVVFSGDLYDREARSVDASYFFVEQCKKLGEKNIPVYIIAGNHDSFRESSEVFAPPENVTLFNSEEVGIEEITDGEGRLIARVLGQSYRGKADSRKMYRSYVVPDTGVYNIGLLHTQLDLNNTSYVPCSISDLQEKKGIHYWALGHIHKGAVLHRDAPTIVYPGIPQGRDFGEQGAGGCLLVNVSASAQDLLSVKFIPASPVIWQRVEVSVESSSGEGPQNLSDIEEVILEKSKEILNRKLSVHPGFSLLDDNWADIFKGYIVQWILTGRGQIHDLLVEQEEDAARVLTSRLQKRMQDYVPFMWTDSVVIRTGRTLPDMDILKAQNPIFNDIEEISEQCFSIESLREELLENMGQIWEKRLDHEDINEERFQLDQEILEAVLMQAKQMVVERILEGREQL